MLEQELTTDDKAINEPVAEPSPHDAESIFAQLHAHFTLQRTAFDRHPYESLTERREH